MDKNFTEINFKEIKEVQDFVRKGNTLESDITVHSDNRYIVDGKSLMGLFSLDLSKALKIEFLEKKIGEEKEFFKFCKELGIIVE